MVDNFVALAEETKELTPINVQYQRQREMLSDFYEDFNRNLRAIISELGGEFIVLKAREFDPKMLKMLAKIHKDLIEIITSINPDKPYEAAAKLAHFVLNRPNGPIIENLDFLAKHHLKTTHVDFKSGKHLVHPEMHSLDKLKALATQLRRFMDEHPLIAPLTPADIPTARLVETLEAVPSFPSTPEQETKPRVPMAKKD